MFEMFDGDVVAVDENRHDVETQRPAVAAVACPPLDGPPGDLPLLAAVNRPERGLTSRVTCEVAFAGHLTCLHLDEDDRPSFPNDQVDLAGTAPPISVHDPVTVDSQILGGEPFPTIAKAFPTVAAGLKRGRQMTQPSCERSACASRH